MCEAAHFTSDKEASCLDGTRVETQAHIMAWVGNSTSSERKVFWLRGQAGSGKTTVANTIARTVEDDDRFLLSCFFCKQDDPSLSNPRRLLPTLAYRFAQQHEDYRQALFPLVQSDARGAGIAATIDPKTQLDRLFAQPLAKTATPSRSHIVVIDALDECGTSRDQETLAKCIL